jgi:hypothetical protein
VVESTLLANGSLIVGGFVQSRPRKLDSEDFALAKLDMHGKLDAGFGEGGVVKTDLGRWEDQVRDLTFTPGGRIIGAGYGNEGGSTDVAVAAYRR